MMALTPLAPAGDGAHRTMPVLIMTDVPTPREHDEELEEEEEEEGQMKMQEKERQVVDKKIVLTKDMASSSDASAVSADADIDVPLKKIAETRDGAVFAAASAPGQSVISVEEQSTKVDSSAAAALHKKGEEKNDDTEQPQAQAPKMRSLVDFEDEHDLRRALMRREDGTLSVKQKHKKNTHTRQDRSDSHSSSSSFGQIVTGATTQNSEDEDDGEYDSDLEDALLEAELDPRFDWMVQNLDAETSEEQTLEEELKRLQVLRSYLILDSEPERAFERLTALASRMFNVPIAKVTLVDLGREWFMSNRGMPGDLRELPRKITFCSHAILSTQDIMVVPDTHEDLRFQNALPVVLPPHIGFYAGCPLVSPEGVKLGTFWYVTLIIKYNSACIYNDVRVYWLCMCSSTHLLMCVMLILTNIMLHSLSSLMYHSLLDVKPRSDIMQSANDKANLRELAALTMELMVTRRREKMFIKEDKTKLVACVAHDLLTPLSGVQMSLDLLKEDAEEVKDQKMRMTPEQKKELIDTAHNCTELMSRICRDTIETFRSDMQQLQSNANSHKVGGGGGVAASAVVHGVPADVAAARQRQVMMFKNGHKVITLTQLVKHITMVMEPYPKIVPLYVTIDPGLPAEFVSHDLKVFRSIINYLTNACKHTQVGCVHLRILLKEKAVVVEHTERNNNSIKSKKSNKKQFIVFEVEDTGNGILEDQHSHLFRPFRDVLEDDKMAHEPPSDEMARAASDTGCGGFLEEETPGLGLFSVATNVGDLGGEYGFRPRETFEFEVSEESEISCPLTTGSVFWFSLPLVEAPSPVAPASIMLQRANSEGTLGSHCASIKSAAESITASYKSRPARGNVVVCETIPKDALRFTKNEVASAQPDAKEAEQHIREATVTNISLPTKNNRSSATNDNVNTAMKPSSIPRKIMLKAKTLCGGRLSSNSQTVVSLRRANGGKIRSSKSEAIVKTQNKIQNKWNSEESSMLLSIDDISEEEEEEDAIQLSHFHSFSRYAYDENSFISDVVSVMEQRRATLSRHKSQSHHYYQSDAGAQESRPPAAYRRGGIQQKLQQLSASLQQISASRLNVDVVPNVNPNQAAGDSNNLDMDPAASLPTGQKHKHRVDQFLRELKTGICKTDTITKIALSGPSASQSNMKQQNRRVRRALVIDDSLVIRKTIFRALTVMGFDVSVATNGMEGLQKLQAVKFDVTFCDFLMPIMDGLDCVQQYRSWEAAHRKSEPAGSWGNFSQNIVGISAHASPRDVQRGIEVGMNSFLGKPVQLEALKDLVKTDQLKEISKQLDDLELMMEQKKKDLAKDHDVRSLPHQVSTSTHVMRSRRGSLGCVEFTEHGSPNPANECALDGPDDDALSNKIPFLHHSQDHHINMHYDNDNDCHVPTCLIAEDVATISNVLVRAIEGQGWKTQLAHNGAEALGLLQQRNWDAVLMDDKMPHLTGVECMQRFRQWESVNRISKQQNVILMSGKYYAPPPEQAHYHNDSASNWTTTQSLCAPSYPSQFDAAVAKPVHLKDLCRLLQGAAEKAAGRENISSDIMVR
jgi:CheY-like chemotaxis protein/signal transduction histidine kinase